MPLAELVLETAPALVIAMKLTPSERLTGVRMVAPLPLFGRYPSGSVKIVPPVAFAHVALPLSSIRPSDRTR